MAFTDLDALGEFPSLTDGDIRLGRQRHDLLRRASTQRTAVEAVRMIVEDRAGDPWIATLEIARRLDEYREASR